MERLLEVRDSLAVSARHILLQRFMHPHTHGSANKKQKGYS